MIDGKRVVAWTPYGRRETVSVLARYLDRDHHRGVVDEWWLCLNTDADQVEDLRYGYALARQSGGWITTKERPAGIPRLTPKQRNTGSFVRYMTDPDTVYVRLDDDIVYVHDDAIANLARHKLATPESVASFPIMWNNAIVSWFLQQAGIIPAAGTETNGYRWPRVGGPYCMDSVGWADGQFAVELHRLLLDHIAAGTVDKLFLYQDFPLQLGLQFSVSTFAALGSMYAGLPEPGVLVPYEEESWHTIHQPRKIGQPNMIVGNALVSHYTFFPQGPIVRATDTLARYRALAEQL